MENTSQFIPTILLNSLWMLPAIWAIAAAAAFLLRNALANQRYLIWVCAIALCLVVPLLSSVQIPLKYTALANRPSSAPGTTTPATSTDDASPLGRLKKRNGPVVRTSASGVRPFVIIYTLFVLFAVIRFARLWWRKERILRLSVPLKLTTPLEKIINQCRNEFQISDVHLASSSSARVPYMLGFFKPLIVFPEKFCAEASDEILLSVVAHEIAHVSRRDYLIKLLVELISLPISFHPITVLIKRQIERERELACDELVTTKFLTPETYARSLLSAADLSLLPAPGAVALSIFDGRILEQRIMRLKTTRPRMNRRVSRLITSVALFALCASTVSLSVFGVELRSDVANRLAPAQLTKIVSAAPEVITESKTTLQQVEKTPNTTDANERSQTACTAEQKRDTAAIPALIALLGDESKTQLVRCWAETSWSPALDTFKSPSPGEQAALALASMGRPAFQPLANQLDHSNPVVRRNAAWAIGELTNMLPSERSSSVPQLITLMSDRDVWVRMAAARAIGELRDRRATPSLVASLGDSDWRMRQMSTWALSELKDDKAVNALCAALLSDSRVEVKLGAAEALGEIASEEALASLKQALNDPEPSVNAKVKWAIEEIEG